MSFLVLMLFAGIIVHECVIRPWNRVDAEMKMILGEDLHDRPGSGGIDS